MRLKQLIIFSTIVLLVSSCTKFLDVLPKGIIIPKKTADYEGLLNSQDFTSINASTLQIMSDDFYAAYPVAPFSPASNIYYWRGRVDEVPTDLPMIWADHYNRIRSLNLIISEVLESTEGTGQEKKQLYAEATVLRAFEFYFLMTIFCPAYDEATAGFNYGLPLVTSVDPQIPLPERPTLQVFADSLINATTRVIPDLPETNLNKTRVTKYVAYGVLSRFYHYMGDYPNSMKYADMALDNPDAQILDYNNYAALTSFPRTNVSPAELYYRSGGAGARQLSPDLVAQYDLANDLRVKLLYPLTGTLHYYRPGAIHPNYGITYAEMFLNKAECLARSGDVDHALEIINEEIRKKRFAPAAYTALMAGSPEEALNAVLSERRRELAFRGIRWSDMKRLDKEGRMPAVQRLSGFTPDATVLASLEPGSSNYTFQIPFLVQSFNPTMPLNK